MRLQRTTLAGAVIGGVLAVFYLVPVAFAVLILRSTSGSHGASTGAWVVIWIVVALVVLAAAALGGALVALAARLIRRTRHR
ncbi:hypothetical protein [Longimicrobium terrae]|uniref:ABC-type antimicrobial peptide transport system permease subunit n=1 Tax=Longimicrobium terrae TaxID=1639882 RepID=A0A841H7M1_9BACT|nr:hypothetical protein [Longimicrobium terrae]MBB4639543.1 hypothetical protein [Longimicrobium terrae]MBB6073914.1 ABC-type antimicrobial peptide transport system permease subunit [Longimicrobium terrae]NNC30111.1 hypothetical protein [Longimicrobium terrae]